LCEKRGGGNLCQTTAAGTGTFFWNYVEKCEKNEKNCNRVKIKGWGKSKSVRYDNINMRRNRQDDVHRI